LPVELKVIIKIIIKITVLSKYIILL